MNIQFYNQPQNIRHKNINTHTNVTWKNHNINHQVNSIIMLHVGIILKRVIMV